jgi:hypothetical protein
MPDPGYSQEILDKNEKREALHASYVPQASASEGTMFAQS